MDDCEFLNWDGSVFYCSLDGHCSYIDCYFNDSHYEDGFFDVLDQSEFYDPSIDDYF